MQNIPLTDEECRKQKIQFLQIPEILFFLSIRMEVFWRSVFQMGRFVFLIQKENIASTRIRKACGLRADFAGIISCLRQGKKEEAASIWQSRIPMIVWKDTAPQIKFMSGSERRKYICPMEKC